MAFPEKSGYYSWAELRMLATSLGLPSSLLVDCVPSEAVTRDPGISTKDLLRLLDMGYFTAPLHFTFGMKSGIYNVKVIAKCLDLLDSGSLSFAGIREANLAFSAYEHLDQKGIKADRHTLMRTLKSGYRVIHHHCRINSIVDTQLHYCMWRLMFEDIPHLFDIAEWLQLNHPSPEEGCLHRLAQIRSPFLDDRNICRVISNKQDDI